MPGFILRLPGCAPIHDPLANGTENPDPFQIRLNSIYIYTFLQSFNDNFIQFQCLFHFFICLNDCTLMYLVRVWPSMFCRIHSDWLKLTSCGAPCGSTPHMWISEIGFLWIKNKINTIDFIMDISGYYWILVDMSS